MKVSDWIVGRHAVIRFPKSRSWFEEELNNLARPHSILQKKKLSRFLCLSNFPATTTSFDASLGYNGSSRRNLYRNGNSGVFLKVL
jgi:hypothetical protein